MSTFIQALSNKSSRGIMNARVMSLGALMAFVGFGIFLLRPVTAQSIDGVINNDGISNNEAHQKCLSAVDYEGCIRVQRGLGQSVIAESPYGYDPDSIRQVILRERIGRYLRFIGRTTSLFGGKILPPIGDVMQREFVYTVDCEDKTFDRAGDRRQPTWGKGVGWKPLSDDPSAKEVYSKYCPEIDQIPLFESDKDESK